MSQIEKAKASIDDVWARKIIDVYCTEWRSIEFELQAGRKPQSVIPRLETIADLVYYELRFEELVNLVDDAIARHDDQLYGYATAEDFRHAAFSGYVNDPAVQSKIQRRDVFMMVLDFAFEQNWFIIDSFERVRNAPVKGVW